MSCNGWFAWAVWVGSVCLNQVLKAFLLLLFTARRGRQRSCTVGVNATFSTAISGVNFVKKKIKINGFFHEWPESCTCIRAVLGPPWTVDFASNCPGNSRNTVKALNTGHEKTFRAPSSSPASLFSLITQGKPGRFIFILFYCPIVYFLVTETTNQQHINFYSMMRAWHSWPMILEITSAVPLRF